MPKAPSCHNSHAASCVFTVTVPALAYVTPSVPVVTVAVPSTLNAAVVTPSTVIEPDTVRPAARSYRMGAAVASMKVPFRHDAGVNVTEYAPLMPSSS